MNTDVNILELFMEGYDKEKKGMNHVNLVIAGKSGVGKSTLINAAFGENLAVTGIGKPVTDEMRVFEHEGCPLRLYDTVGLELDEEKQRRTIEGIKRTYQEKLHTGSMDEILHGMWYCVQSNSNRLEESETSFINAIAEDMPVILVITQVITKNQAQAFKDAILNQFPDLKVKNIIMVLAQDYDDDGVIKKAFGVDFLVEYMAEILPTETQKSWAAVQRASLKLKKDRAQAIVNATAAASFGEGYLPLPFSDCVALIPTQIGMIVSITVTYGFEISQSVITGIVTALLGTAGTTIAGRTIVSNLLKAIPGVGIVMGGTISGATAALLTVALGETYIAIMDMMAKGELKSEDIECKGIQDMMKEMLVTRLKKGGA